MTDAIPFAAGLILGAAVAGLIGASKVDRLKLAWTEAHAAELVLSLEQIKAAHQRGDEAAQRLGAALAENATLKTERDRALIDATAGRECLSADAVRVLNRGAGPVRVPAATGGPAATDAGGIATDTDIALWASDAHARYAECTRRLAALIQWHEGDMQAGGMP